ncbi:MAG: glycosyltransferase family 4 protein [Flavobacteriaceae bacterium]|nr:glycosyltransferase family 4 protein [Flavobacteriaceae bacterium]
MTKVLIICYYWPPAGGPGVQRWLKFVKYLPEFGIEPIVFVPDNPHYPIVDKELQQEVSDTLQLIRFPISEPYRWAGFLAKKQTQKISSGMISHKNPSLLETLLLFVRGNFFIPDARKSWVKPSVAFLSKKLKAHPVDVIITSGPPHSLHLIGQSLKRTLGIRWLADFRDPWTDIGYHKKLRLLPFSKQKHLKMEQSVLDQADSILVTSKALQKLYQKRTDNPVVLITNGFDKTEISTGKPSAKVFNIVHTGSLLSARNPLHLWEVLAELIEEDADFKDKLRIDLAGVVSREVLYALEEHGLSAHVLQLGYLPHLDAKKTQAGAQMLLLIEIDSEETRQIIPGKIFEYFQAKRPILAIGPAAWEVSDMLEKTQSGMCFEHREKIALKKYIVDSFQKFKEGKLQVNSKNIDVYSRKNLTASLAALIKK